MSEASAAVERYREPQTVAVLDDRAMKSIEFQAKTIYYLDNRLKNIQSVEERKGKAVALAITLYNLGLPITAPNAKKLHLIGDEVMESAQLLIGLLAKNGHEIRVVEEGEHRAVVRGWRYGAGEPHEVTYTVDQAKRSGALDEWVERWENTQNGKRYCAEKLVLRVDGAPATDGELPDWAAKQVKDGRVKRNEAWFRYRSDMLVNRAIRRLAKRMGGDALLGVGAVDEDEPLAERVDPPVVEAEPERDDIVDAEVVEPDDEPAAQAPVGEKLFDDDDPQRPFAEGES